jgi:uncharacterized protein (DUF2141 family)
MTERLSSIPPADLTIEISNLDAGEGEAVILVWQQRTSGRPWPSLLKPDRVVSMRTRGETMTRVFSSVECGNYAALVFQVATRPELAPVRIAGVATHRAGAPNSINPLIVLNDISRARFKLASSQCIAIQLQPVASSWGGD